MQLSHVYKSRSGNLEESLVQLSPSWGCLAAVGARAYRVTAGSLIQRLSLQTLQENPF